MPTPTHFEQLGEIINEEMLTEMMVCSNDPQEHIEEIDNYIKACFDHVCINNMAQDQNGFIQFCKKEILPYFRE